MKHRLPRSSALLLAAVLFAGPIKAQTEDDIYILPPFEVISTRDTYTATNAVSGTRMRMEIRDLPINLQVVTEGFIRDLGSSDLDEVLRFTSGVQSNVDNVGNFGKFNVRGIQQTYSLRNGFRRYGPNDVGNAAQVEVVKGPASLFYGQVFPGGVVNVMTKRPLWQPFHVSLEVAAGSYDSYRTGLDVGGMVGERIAYRLNTVYDRWGSFVDFNNRKSKLIAPVVTFRPWQRLSITVEFEHLQRDEQAPQAGLFVISEDYFRARDAADPNDPFNLRQNPFAFAQEFARRVNEPIPSRYWDILEEGTFRTVVDALGVETRRTFPYSGIHPDLPRNFNTNGPDAFNNYESNALTANIDLEITSWLRYRASFLMSRDDRERYSNFVNTTFRSGVDAILGPTNSFARNDVMQTQNDFFFEFETGPIRHRLLAGAETYSDSFTSRERAGPNFPGFTAYNRPPMRLPVETNLTRTWAGLFVPARPIVDFTLIPWGPPPGNFGTTGDRRTKGHAFYFSDQITMLDDRLIFLGGMRYEDFTTKDYTTGREAGRNDSTVQGGLIYRIVPDVGIFVSYAESFFRNEFPQFPSPDGLLDPSRLAPPETGTGMELGVKFDLFDNRLSGIVTAFKLTRENQLNNVRDLSFTPPRQFSFLSGKYEVEGFEMEAHIRPINNWVIIVGYTFLDARQTTDSLTLRAGQRWPNVPEHQFNVWHRYDFTEGPLEGFYFGGGARYLGSRRAGNDSNLAQGWAFESAGYWEVDLLFGYRFEAFGGSNSLALNVTNALDREFIRGGQTLPSEPRRFRLTYRVDF